MSICQYLSEKKNLGDSVSVGFTPLPDFAWSIHGRTLKHVQNAIFDNMVFRKDTQLT